MSRALLFLLSVYFALLAGPASAHRLQPAYLELTEQNDGVFSVLWKRPLVAGIPMDIGVVMPGDCKNLSEPRRQPVPGSAIERWMVNCGPAGLKNQPITIKGLELTDTDVLLRISLLDGGEYSEVLRPNNTVYLVPSSASSLAVIGSYSSLGVEHILGGVDHLLFVLGLMLIVGGAAALVKTITAFTVAHSITLAMATLGYVHLPSAPVEAVIALSILFLAVELARKSHGVTGLTARFPWIVAFSFGLLHGFGFAGALTETGLPQHAVPLALLFFNIGVEIGQLLFVAAVLISIRVMRPLLISRPAWAEMVPAYLVGSLASFWVIERTVSFWITA